MINYIYENRIFFLKNCHFMRSGTIKKFIHPEKDECLIGQDYNKQNIFILE